MEEAKVKTGRTEEERGGERGASWTREEAKGTLALGVAGESWQGEREGGTKGGKQEAREKG